MLLKQIENAQRKVEEHNFLIRKRVLEYDDDVRAARDRLPSTATGLEGRDMGPVAFREQIGDVINLVDEYTPGDDEERDLEARGALDQTFEVDFGADRGIDRESVDCGAQAVADQYALKLYGEREEEFGVELMRALERYLLLQLIDQRWREHLYDKDYLREGIHLRGFAQIEPIVAYKNEAFTFFQDLMNTIWSDFARMIYNVEVQIEGENGAPAAAERWRRGAAVLGRTMDDQLQRLRRLRR